MQHDCFALLYDRVRIEQKPRYLKVYLTNPADCNIIQNSISHLNTVETVNITNKQEGSLTVHHASGKADAVMEKDVKQVLRDYYSYTLEENISLVQTRRLIKELEKNSQEQKLLKSAIKSHNEFRFRHAFDDYRLCIECYARKVLNLKGNKTLENLRKELLKEMQDKGFPTHLRNCMSSIIDYFCKYQNENVKHRDNIPLIDTMCIFTWGNMLLEQMILLNKMLNWRQL